MFDPAKFKKNVMANGGKKKRTKKPIKETIKNGKETVQEDVLVDRSTMVQKSDLEKCHSGMLVDRSTGDIKEHVKERMMENASQCIKPPPIEVAKVPENLSLPASREIEEFAPDDLICESRFCMGCFRNCCDYLGTNMEIWWCRRDPDEVGNIEFVLIKNTYKVKQCKWRMDVWKSIVPF